MKILRNNWVFYLLLAFVIIGCAAMQEKRAKMLDPANILEGANYIGNENCKGCHEDKFKSSDFHSRIKDFEAPSMKLGCEGCHGPGSLHASGAIEKIISFKDKDTDFTRLCISCHQSKNSITYQSSAHYKEGIGCVNCHKMHGKTERKLLKEKEFVLCSNCHSNVKAKFYFTSHHPIKEDKFSCSACHNVHNDTKALLKGEDEKNEICLSCHRKYQGPFVFEHAPVVEDCLNCHDAHGSIANNLLKQNEPFVCLQCHEAHFHALRTSGNFDVKFKGVLDPYQTNGTIDATSSTTLQPSQVTIKGTESGFQKAFLTKCTQCHKAVHGSDLPSQGTTSQGKNLSR